MSAAFESVKRFAVARHALAFAVRAVREAGDELTLQRKKDDDRRNCREYRSRRDQLPRRLPHAAQRLQPRGKWPDVRAKRCLSSKTTTTSGVSALQSLGYRVFEAADGSSALRLLAGADDPRIDLLFTDVVLPGGMSGRSLAEEIIARRPGLPVLFTSGYTRKAIAQQGSLAPGARIIAKPYTLESLATHVRQAIDSARR